MKTICRLHQVAFFLLFWVYSRWTTIVWLQQQTLLKCSAALIQISDRLPNSSAPAVANWCCSILSRPPYRNSRKLKVDIIKSGVLIEELNLGATVLHTPSYKQVHLPTGLTQRTMICMTENLYRLGGNNTNLCDCCAGESCIFMLNDIWGYYLKK